VVERLICNQLVGGSSPFAGFCCFALDDSFGRLPEWLKGTDCKSVGLRLRRFESYTSHFSEGMWTLVLRLLGIEPEA
jgi:hypothetical protein